MSCITKSIVHVSQQSYVSVSAADEHDLQNFWTITTLSLQVILASILEVI